MKYNRIIPDLNFIINKSYNMSIMKYSIKKCIFRYLSRCVHVSDGESLLLDDRVEFCCVGLEIVSWWEGGKLVPSCACDGDDFFVSAVVDESWMLLRVGLSRLLGSSNSSWDANRSSSS